MSIFSKKNQRDQDSDDKEPGDNEFDESEEADGVFVDIVDLDKKEDLQTLDAQATPDAKSMKGKNKEKFKRMREREDRKPFMIYPEDSDKANWDLFITLVLVYTCVATPARIAFSTEDTVGWATVRWLVDFFFLVDIIIIFFSAYQDEDFKTIDNRNVIACAYIQSWFFLDVFAIIPFSSILESSGSSGNGSQENLNDLARLAKIGRLYKLIKLTKLLRILKIVKERSKLLKYVRELVKLGYGFERLAFMTIAFLLICHIIACLWVFFATFSDDF